jgi:uncharacterized membrane protein YfcA
MEYLLIGIVAFLTSSLTLFSGFGLGTLLLPAFALFFEINVAIAMTAIVHLLNNILKFILLGKYAQKAVVLRFGLPAIFAAYLGAKVLLWFTDLPALYTYQISGNIFFITPVKVVIAILMLLFAAFEIAPALKNISFSKKYLPLGGVLSGFFGGISGHQGALRSAFLLRYGLTKEEFIGTGISIALLIDISRIFVYSSRFTLDLTQDNILLLITAVLCATTGAVIASRLLKKVTMNFVQYSVSILLTVIALGLGTGII